MKSKIAVVVIALLFAIGFGAGGAFGLSSLAGHLNGWWQARSWQPVPATVLDTVLEQSRGDSTTYRVTARYRYTFAGKSYGGTRVGFSEGSDNVGNWQREHDERLSAAQRSGERIEVWVDPERPEHSVIDRSIRWNMVAFSLPFAILFPLVSLGALWVMFHALRTPTAELSSAPALGDNAREIRSDARPGIRGLWLFATLWGLIAFPIAFIFIPQEFGRSWAWMFVLLFPLVGVGLIWAAAARTIRFLRNGEVSISLNPAQPRLGNAIAVRARFKHTPPAGEYIVSLLCEKVDSRGEDTSYNTAWRQERVVRVAGPTLNTSFSPSANLPASQPDSGIYHRWRVLLRYPDSKDERAFDIVVAEAQPGFASDNLAPAFLGAAGSDVPARPIPESIAKVVDGASALTIDYSTKNMRGTAVFIVLFGAVSAGVGSFLMFGRIGDSSVVARAMGLVFAAVGIAIFVFGVFTFTHRRSIEIARGRVHVADRWLLNSNQHEFAVSEVKKLTPRITGTTVIGSRRYDHHQISALLSDGRTVTLASDIRDAGVAQTLMQVFQRHLKLADGAVASIAGAGMEQARPGSPI